MPGEMKAQLKEPFNFFFEEPSMSNSEYMGSSDDRKSI